MVLIDVCVTVLNLIRLVHSVSVVLYILNLAFGRNYATNISPYILLVLPIAF